MRIKATDIVMKKRVGTLGNLPLFLLCTNGGFWMVVTPRNGEVETLGTGSHPELARHITRLKEPKAVFDELSKSEGLEPVIFQDLLPKWIEFTNKIRKLQGLNE